MKNIEDIKKQFEDYLREGINFNNILNNAYFKDAKKDQLIQLLQLNGIKQIGIMEMKDLKLDENPKITLLYSPNDDTYSSDPNKLYSFVSDFTYIGKVWYENEVWANNNKINHFVDEIKICGTIDLIIRTFNHPAWCQIHTRKAILLELSV